MLLTNIHLYVKKNDFIKKVTVEHTRQCDTLFRMCTSVADLFGNPERFVRIELDVVAKYFCVKYSPSREFIFYFALSKHKLLFRSVIFCIIRSIKVIIMKIQSLSFCYFHRQE